MIFTGLYSFTYYFQPNYTAAEFTVVLATVNASFNTILAITLLNMYR